MKAIPTINVKDLKSHPRNTDIYGSEDVQELADKIKESGWVKPLVITPNGTIISGHRRLKACLSLGIEEVEYEMISFNNENEELERLLLENQSREKTNEQKIREGLMWEEVIKEKARLRKLGTLNNQSVEVENFPQRENEEVGKTRDLVAERIGVGSGKTYEVAKKVVNQIDNLKEQGKEKDAEFIKATLNESVNAAKNVLKTDLSKVDQGLKDKVINKEITPKQAIKEIKKEITIENEGKDNFPHDSQKEIRETKIINKESVEKIKVEIETKTNIISENIVNDFEADKNNFVANMSKYIESEETLENLDNSIKKKIRNDIDDIKKMLDKIENILF